MKEVILTEEQLQEKLAYWQKVLRLSDWVISAKITRERDFSRGGRAGEIEWVIHNKTAAVRMLDSVDYPEGLIEDQDMEQTLVHELLHLHLAPIRYNYGNNEDVYEIFEEQAIDSIATALVRVSRENGDRS